jgi:type II secretory ATPase GspE/PulE/Tfp pilus assembly ATPase PilB-like protein
MSPAPHERFPSTSLSRSPGDPQPSAVDRADVNQMFALVDGILPFEACLYYQVVPLSIEGSRINLGMVNPDDTAAADYMRRLLSYINCSIVPWQISSDWHRDVLSRYLNHASKVRQKAQPPSPGAATEAPTVVSADSDRSAPPSPVNPKTPQPANRTSTLIVDTPDNLGEAKPAGKAPAAAKPGASGIGKAPLHLHLEPRYRTLSLDAAAALTPKELVQLLLSRVLDDGIGRLYLERQADQGRILWSKDGVLQSALDNISASVFQGVVNELKLLTHLSLIPVRKARQVEIERLYEGSRVLLRFRVMPGTHGEEATLQVLRGAALKFYQQQQIDKMERDALTMAQGLQQRLNEIRDRARKDLNFASTQADTLPALIDLLKHMEVQVRDMLSQYDPTSKEPPEQGPGSAKAGK